MIPSADQNPGASVGESTSTGGTAPNAPQLNAGCAASGFTSNRRTFRFCLVSLVLRLASLGMLMAVREVSYGQLRND